jgi:hypothetical protein
MFTSPGKQKSEVPAEWQRKSTQSREETQQINRAATCHVMKLVQLKHVVVPAEEQRHMVAAPELVLPHNKPDAAAMNLRFSHRT